MRFPPSGVMCFVTSTMPVANADFNTEVTEGTELEATIKRMFCRGDVAFLHAHNAKRGCYSCRIDRV